MTQGTFPKYENSLGVIPMVSLKGNRMNKLLCR